MRQFSQNYDDMQLVNNIIDLSNLFKDLGVSLDLWECQNIFYGFVKKVFAKMKTKRQKVENFVEYCKKIEELAALLSINIKISEDKSIYVETKENLL